MNTIPGRFARFTRVASAFVPRSNRSGSTSPAHRSFRLTRSAKEKMIGRTMPHGYVTQPVKKEMKSIEEQIIHAVGRGDKTFTDQHGVEHKITDDMRFFAKETQQSGHTLTRKSEVSRFAEGEVEFNREFGINMKSGLNIGSDREAAGKIVKGEEAALGSNEEHHNALKERQIKLQERAARLQRIGVQANSMAAIGSSTTPVAKDVQPLGTATASAHPTPRPSNIMTLGITAGRHTDLQDHSDESPIVAPPSDPIAEENQALAASIPPAKEVDLPDTTNVDRGLPF